MNVYCEYCGGFLGCKRGFLVPYLRGEWWSGWEGGRCWPLPLATIWPGVLTGALQAMITRPGPSRRDSHPKIEENPFYACLSPPTARNLWI